MSEALPYNSGPLYYRHSGRVSSAGLVKALALGTLVAVPLGAAYAYADLYNPIAGWITFLVTGGTGFLLGKILAGLIKSGKLRNVPVAMIMAAWVTGLMFLASWDFWVFARLQRLGGEVPLLDVLTHPAGVWDYVMRVNAVGAWKLNGATPSGVFLGLIWLAEAGVLVGIPLVMAWKAVKEFPFCEQCNKWCTSREVLNVKPGDAAALRRKLEAKDFNALTALGKSPSSAMHFWHVSFQGCADCDTTQTLCVDDFTLTYDKNGKLQTKKKPIVTRLLLTPEDTVEVATAAAMLTAPPPETAEAPQADADPAAAEASETLSPGTPDTPA